MFMELGLHIVLKPLLATEDDLLIGTYTPGKGSPTQWLSSKSKQVGEPYYYTPGKQDSIILLLLPEQ